MGAVRSASGGLLRLPGGGLLQAGISVSASVLHSFDLTDTSGSGSSGFFRVGLAFEKGDIPSGQIPSAALDDDTAVRSAMLGRNTWSDGSLRSCTLVGEVAGGITGTETINITAAVGTQGTSGLNPVTYLSGQDDLNVQVTNHSGHTTGAQSDRAYSLNAALAVGTRHEVTDDTPVCVRLRAWQMPSGEVHLKCYHHVDIWLDSGGSVEAVEWVPVMSQDWIPDDPIGTGSEQKEARNYDASIREATTVLESHTSIQHAYHCRWAGLRTADDDQHGKPLWIDKGTAMPTVNVAYSDDSLTKIAKTGYLPPIARDKSYPAGSFVDTIVPLGEFGTSGNVHNHRRAINGTGGYNGRGIVSDMDVRALEAQTAATWRVARVSAQAALSVFMHHRDHRTIDTVDFPGLVAAPIDQLGAQTYADLGAEDTVILSNNSPSGSFSDGQNYDVATGPTRSASAPGSVGTFTGWDDAHHHSYGYMMAFVEGEAYLADAVVSAFDMPHRRNATGTTTQFTLAFQAATTRASTLSIPSTNYGDTHIADAQERSIGWTLLSCARALQVLPDSDKHVPYIKNQLSNFSSYANDSIGFFPADEVTRGGWEPRFTTGAPIGSQFMNSFCMLGAWTSVPITDDLGYTGVKAYAEQVTKLNATHYDLAPYIAVSDRDLRFLDGNTKLSPPPTDEALLLKSGSVTSDVFGYTTMFDTLKIRDGDVLYMSDAGSQGQSTPVPSGLSADTQYFVVNANTGSNTFQVSLTDGGSAVTGITDTATINFGLFAADFSTTPLGTGGATTPNDDSSGQINYCAFQIAYGYGSTSIDSSLFSAVETFYAPKKATWGASSSFTSWNMDGSLIK